MQEYNQTDKQVHWLSQVIAKVNRTFVPGKDDDSHTNLYFDAMGGRLFGRWIDGPDGRIILALNLQTFAFEWMDERQHVLHEVQVFEKDLVQLEQEVAAYPATIHLDTDRFSVPLHFGIPEYGFEVLHQGDVSSGGMQQWFVFRELANRSCQAMLGYLQAESEIRIWPHHFDTGIYAMVTPDLGLGFGLAMEDAMVGSPYFYLSGYNQRKPVSYENPSRLTKGSWITGEHWNGAVLTLEMLGNTSEEESGLILQEFISEATGWFLKQ
ncbi:MAG: hypothetical protein P1P82_03220 [Bacteroidales bacterium]|nr:hypothetical protein [Bacteroidales bacterium]MDT8430115.1 hypothetical protein [Bacteroidales bacterium]